jgi:hypothetical protein
MCSTLLDPFCYGGPHSRLARMMWSARQPGSGSAQTLLNNQGKRIADKGGRAQASGLVTVRSTRLVQLPEREECVPSDAAGFAMLSLTPV